MAENLLGRSQGRNRPWPEPSCGLWATRHAWKTRRATILLPRASKLRLLEKLIWPIGFCQHGEPNVNRFSHHARMRGRRVAQQIQILSRYELGNKSCARFLPRQGLCKCQIIFPLLLIQVVECVLGSFSCEMVGEYIILGASLAHGSKCELSSCNYACKNKENNKTGDRAPVV